MTHATDPTTRTDLRARAARPADRETIDRLIADPRAGWESPSHPADPKTIFEFEDRIVGIDAGTCTRTLALEPPAADPPQTLEAAERPGPTECLVGRGLWIESDLSEETAARIHRTGRTLLGIERAVRAIVCTVPLPPHEILDPAGVAQMCLHGAIDWPPIRIPIEDGWWPVGLTPDERALVLTWRNRQ